MTVTCPYCGGDAELVDSAEVYDGRSYGPIYLCRPCQAWVGVHKAGPLKWEPLGRLADAELRQWKRRAHDAFDVLWKAKMATGYSKGIARRLGYRWLADTLGIEEHRCHIGMFDVDQCRRVVEVCSRRGE